MTDKRTAKAGRARTPATEQKKLRAIAAVLAKARRVLLELGRAEPPDDAMDEGTIADSVLYRIATAAESVAGEIVELEARILAAARVTSADLEEEWRALNDAG
jgi:hypothetical protein